MNIDKILMIWLIKVLRVLQETNNNKTKLEIHEKL